MKHKVLVVEPTAGNQRVLKRVIGKADLEAVCCESLTEARHVFNQSTPENYLCAITNYVLPDAQHGEAIDYAIESFLPTIAITDKLDETIRRNILQKDIVDYLSSENAQMFEYLSRLLSRLEKNKATGVIVVNGSRSGRKRTMALLSRHNFVTYGAADQDSTLALLERHESVQLILVNEHLHTGSPTELIDRIRQSYDRDERAIIGITGENDSSMSARFIKSGANDYLRAPYSHEEFLCRVLQNVELIEHIEAIRQAANADFLTGLPNRRHFFKKVNRILKHCPSQIALALIDLDHFKSINDTYGHECGDQVLQHTAKLIEAHFSQHIYARFGGEEFCVFFADQSLDQAVCEIEAFRKDLNSRHITYKQQTFSYSFSAGVTVMEGEGIESMLHTADQYLYKAKQRGRNQTVSD